MRTRREVGVPWEQLPEVLDVWDILRLAGGRLGRTSIYEAARQGLIPSVRVSRRVLFSKAAVRRWLEGAGAKEHSSEADPC